MELTAKEKDTLLDIAKKAITAKVNNKDKKLVIDESVLDETPPNINEPVPKEDETPENQEPVKEEPKEEPKEEVKPVENGILNHQSTS